MAAFSFPPTHTSTSTTSAFNFVFSSTGAPLPEKRTNSLAFSASDCHTCRSMRRHCDRRRPRCNVCTDSGITCSGYVQKLDWQVGVASRGKMARKTFSAPTSSEQAALRERAEVSRPKNFAFVHQKGVRRKRARTSGYLHSKGDEPATERRQDRGRKKTKLHQPSPQTTAVADSPTEIVSREDDESSLMIPCRSLGNFYNLPPDVSEVLNFYEWRYSFIPLTFRVQVNPWHMCLSMAYENPCLMHAILALGKRYSAQLLTVAEDVRVLELKDSALSTFSTALDVGTNPAILIGTILTLVALDYAESGYSNWSVHFHGAYRVIQAAGGIEIAEQDTALQSQIACLVWYDVTSALISRRAPVFPRSVLEALMAWQSKSQWTMLALNGFPDDLLLDIYDVAWAASHSIGMGEASTLYRRLWSAHLDAPDANIARLMDCWRLSLLLYCTRLFEPPASTFRRVLPSSSSSSPSATATDTPLNNDEFDDIPISMATPVSSPDASRRLSALQSDVGERCQALAEEIFWLVRDLPPTSDIQKQCLIPVTLAACEMDSDPENFPFRIMAEEYCRRWSRQSGLRTFDTALGLVQTVWRMRDRQPGFVWWGNLVGSSIRSQFVGRGDRYTSDGEDLEDDLASGKDFLLG